MVAEYVIRLGATGYLRGLHCIADLGLESRADYDALHVLYTDKASTDELRTLQWGGFWRRSGSDADRARQDVAIRWVRKRELVDSVFVAGRQGRRQRLVHQPTDALEILPGDVGIVCLHVPHPLLVDLLGPVGILHLCDGEPHQKIPQLSGVENVRVVDADGPVGHGSLSDG